MKTSIAVLNTATLFFLFIFIPTVWSQSGRHPLTNEKYADIKKIESPSGAVYYMVRKKRQSLFYFLTKSGGEIYCYVDQNFYNENSYKWILIGDQEFLEYDKNIHIDISGEKNYHKRK